MEQTAVFVNPAAGGGRAARVWRRLERRRGELRELSAERIVRASDRDGSRRALAELLATTPGPDRLIVVGGDGSVHLAADAILRRAPEDRPALGLIPAGTGSDLARSLALPRRPEAALDHLLAARPRRLDALRLRRADGETLHSINVFSAGISGMVDLEVNARPRRGALAFLAASIAAVLAYRAVPCRIELDGETVHDGPLYLLAVGNGRSFGKGMKGLPLAELDDGLADVLVVPPMPRLELLLLRLPQLYFGAHLGARRIVHRRARRVRIAPGGELPPFDLDGETYDASLATVEVLPGAISWLG